MTLALDRVSYAARGRLLVRELTLEIVPGKVTVLAGPNGAGKSTALKLMCGDLAPASGEVRLNGRPLAAWSPSDRALQRAVLTQDPRLDFPFTAAEVVAMGRSAHHGRSTRDRDAAIVREALLRTGTGALANRDYTTLSGGERQRVHLARVLAQIAEPAEEGWDRFLLLDEPTSSLDITHQGVVMAIGRTLAAEGVGVFAILHDLNLAAAYADELVLMREGEIVAAGHPDEILTTRTVEAVYETRVHVQRHRELGRVVVLPLPL
jgi:iron complex transport system ATP-binding protein